MDTFIQNIGVADIIQIFILFALLWYSIETRELKKWQKKQVQLAILNLDMQRCSEQNKNINSNPTPYGEDFPIIIQKIYKFGKFDPKVLYSKAFKLPPTSFQKLICFLKNKLKGK